MTGGFITVVVVLWIVAFLTYAWIVGGEEVDEALRQQPEEDT